MRRFLFLLAVLAVLPAGPVAAAPGRAAACVPAAEATLRHSFDGPGGSVTVTANRPLCTGRSRSVTLVSYTAADAGRFVYDRDTGRLGATNRSLTLHVAVPNCRTEVAAVLGTDTADEIVSADRSYGGPLVSSASAGPSSAYVGGSGTCSPEPRVTFTNACDGRFTATLSNGSEARTAAVFRSGGRLVRVAPGDSSTLSAAPGGTITVRVSTFTTYVGTWRPPATGCPTGVPTEPAAATAGSASAGPDRSLAASAAPASSVPSTEPTIPPAAGAPFVTPAPTATDDVAAGLADAGLSTGSVLAVLLGLLMIAGGGVALTYLVREWRRPD